MCAYIRIVGLEDGREGLVHESVGGAEQLRSPGHLEVDGADDDHLPELHVVGEGDHRPALS